MPAPTPASPASALKAKLVHQAIRDPLFKMALAEASVEIKKHAISAPNEATIESAFERILYDILKDVGILFHPVKEEPIDTKRHVAKGRTDSRLGGLVIEYKRPTALKSQKDVDSAIAQLENYINSISNTSKNEAIGFLIDGLNILNIHSVSGKTISISSLDQINQDNLGRLVRAIVSLESSALSAKNLIKDFCSTGYDGILFKVAKNLNKILCYNATIKTEMLRTEWEGLFRLAHEDQSLQKRILERRAILGDIYGLEIKDPTMEYRAIFALHTAYAIILKLISFRVVSDIKFGTTIMDYKSLTKASPDVLRSFCSSLEDGEIFRQIGIINLLEGDFFSWYSDKKQWNKDISDGILEIFSTLARYEDVKSVFDTEKSVDLFRSLYEAAVPQIIRGSFGEFYTPYWLAEHVIESSVTANEWSAIDPCCGSGTFIIAAISKLRAELKIKKPAESIDVQEILTRVAGIDLNPLAVLTARVHYFIHIADLLEDKTDDIVIPVFLGDASNVPIHKKFDSVEFIHYELKTLKTPLMISLPKSAAVRTEKFSLQMFEFERLIQEGSYVAAKSYLLKEFNPDSIDIIDEKVSLLADQIIDLEKKEWNGIWARVIANFITTACIGPFTNIIGNPPWIDWKSLPSGYREKVKELCVDKGLFSGAGRTGGINLNICALITHVAAANWLAPNGRLAFLMPKELSNQASYEGWRRAVGGAKFSLTAMHDWSKVGHPFDPVKEDFMTFIFDNKKLNQSIIPVVVHSRVKNETKSHLWTSLAEAKKHIVPAKAVAGQIIEGSSIYTISNSKVELANFKKIAGACSYIGRVGIEFYPQELMLFKYDGAGPRKGTVWVKNIQVTKSKYKIPQQRILLETKYLFPLVKGPNIGEFEYDDPDLIVAFPYDSLRPHAPLSQDELRKSSPLLLSHFRKFKSQLEQQTAYSDAIRGAGEFYGVARTGPYSFQNCYVAFRDNTKWCATYIRSKIMPWGEEKRFLFQNHAASICEREDGSFICETEAFFIAGIFNTDIVKRFIYASSDTRSFKIRPPIHVPIYNNNDATHRKISRLAKLAFNKSEKRLTHMNQLEDIYLDLCDRRPLE